MSDDTASRTASAMPYLDLVGIEVTATDPGAVAGVLSWAATHCTVGGVMHGGAIMSLADTLGGICAFGNVPPGAMTPTIESKTNFLRAIRAGEATARSVPLHAVCTTIVVQTEVRDSQGRLAALTVQTQAVIGP